MKFEQPITMYFIIRIPRRCILTQSKRGSAVNRIFAGLFNLLKRPWHLVSQVIVSLALRTSTFHLFPRVFIATKGYSF